jgi:hypothetical protein
MGQLEESNVRRAASNLLLSRQERVGIQVIYLVQNDNVRASELLIEQRPGAFRQGVAVARVSRCVVAISGALHVRPAIAGHVIHRASRTAAPEFAGQQPRRIDHDQRRVEHKIAPKLWTLQALHRRGRKGHPRGLDQHMVYTATGSARDRL